MVNFYLKIPICNIWIFFTNILVSFKSNSFLCCSVPLNLNDWLFLHPVFNPTAFQLPLNFHFISVSEIFCCYEFQKQSQKRCNLIQTVLYNLVRCVHLQHIEIIKLPY
jgi:hypothetical protein